MNKCPNCGTEFDGKFCPNCGSEWEENKICPQCGAKLGGEARFCNECGYSFVGQLKDGKKVSSAPQNVMQKIYTALGFAPFALFALFSVLLFAFFAAPVAEMVMGMGFPNESLGNVYSMQSGILSELPQLNGSMIALFIFLALSVLYSAAMGVIQFLPKFKYKEIKILNRNFPLPLLMGFAANVFYLIFFIIGIAIIGIISSADEGMGLLASGACPILLIVFALLFAALAAGSLVARFLLAKKTPELSKAEEERKNQYIEAEKARKEQFYATHNPPVPPVETEGKNYKREVVYYKHEKRRYDKAIDKKTPEAVIWLETHKKVWIPVLALLLVAVILISVLVPIFTNKFRIGVAEKIQLGYTKDQVVQILGEPYEGGDTDTVWKYYGKEYITIQDKIKKNNEEQEKAFENGNESSLTRLVSEEEKLKEQLKAVTYSYYEISFMPEGENSYSVSSVYFEKNRQDGGEQTEKEVKKVTLSNAGCYDDRTSGTQQVKLIKYDEENPQYCAYFTDGSFFRAYMPATAETETTEVYNVLDGKKVLYFKWSDKFASYDFRSEALYIGEVNSDGVWSTYYKAVKSIWLPDSVTSVTSIGIYGSDAFSGCTNLESITVSENNQTYSSQDGILYNKDKTELICVPPAKTSVTIPEGVASIGSYAFDKSLESITVSDDNQNFSGQDGVLYNKDKTELICVPQAKTSVTIPDSVTSIGDYAFRYCSLLSVTIPDSVAEIGYSAFYECTSLTGITIGNGVTSIGSGAFYNCTSLTSVTIGNGVTSIDSEAFYNCDSLESITISEDNQNFSSQDGVLYSKDKTELIRVPQAKISVTIPDSVISIGESAFRGCEILESITIPNSVTSIGESAFIGTAYYNNQDNWTDGVLYIGNCLITATLSGNYEIKSGTKVIADDAFSYCTSLTSITIPDSVTSIGYEAFRYCISLTSITVADGNTAYSSQDGILYNKEKTEFIHIPPAIKGSVTIPDSVTSIGDYAFNDCISLTSITMGSGVTSIGESAFEGCTSLTSITMGSGVTSIGMEAFRGCANLTSITIPDSVTYIGSQAFYNTNIKTATMPALAIYDIPKDNLQSVTITSGNIRYRAFSSCTSLKSVTIGNSVTSIESNAFSSCTSLTSVTIGNSVTSIGSSAFGNCTSLTSITLPFVGNGSDKTYFGYIFGANYPSYNSDYVPSSLKTVVITGGTSIGGFYNCSKLESITIGNGVTEIGGIAFQNCTSLKSVTIGNSVTSIGNNAFQNCTSLESVNFENTAGWKVSTSSDMLDPTEVDVKSPAQNAVYLTDTYNTYHWKRYE